MGGLTCSQADEVSVTSLSFLIGEYKKEEFSVDFYGRAVSYDFTETNELSLAYAISVHKSQGSEYPAVIIPLMTQHYALLQRNHLYSYQRPTTRPSALEVGKC
jgi:hypothetical protein